MSSKQACVSASAAVAPQTALVRILCERLYSAHYDLA